MLFCVFYLQLVTVQVQELLAVHSLSCEFRCVLVHVHAHQPVTDLLIGPVRDGPVLPLIFFPCSYRFIIQSLQKTQIIQTDIRKENILSL